MPKTDDLHKWKDDELEWEICSMVHEMMVALSDCRFHFEVNSDKPQPSEVLIKFIDEVTPYSLEWKLRHPEPVEYDENGNYKGN